MIRGKFKNISLNTLLNQSQLATWERINIKLSSSNFKISGKGNDNQSWETSLSGKIPINGSIYFTSSDEERFGAALLSLLVEKIPDLKSISQSINFLLSTYANIPSSLNGTLIINNGLISSQEILVTNKEGKSFLSIFVLCAPRLNPSFSTFAKKILSDFWFNFLSRISIEVLTPE